MKKSRIGRRQFMQYSVAGAAFTASSKASAGPAATLPHRSENTSETFVTSDADVLVVGGGAAGTIAAVQASRAGATTVIIERGSQLGGTTTTAGVSFPGLFDAWGRQIIDCTGGAEVAGMLNLPRLRGKERQPGSMLFKLDKANNPGRTDPDPACSTASTFMAPIQQTPAPLPPQTSRAARRCSIWSAGETGA